MANYLILLPLRGRVLCPFPLSLGRFYDCFAQENTVEVKLCPFSGMDFKRLVASNFCPLECSIREKPATM